MSFAHLHVHSQFSLLNGTASPEAIARRAAELEMSAVALTDSANLYGGVAFYKACTSEGIRPVLGTEITVQPEGLAFRDPERRMGGYQVRLLVEDDRGYQNLCKLITAGIFEGIHYRPRIDLDLLEKHRDGLIVLSGGRRGVLGKHVIGGDLDRARDQVVALRERLRDDQLFLELEDLGLEGEIACCDAARLVGAELDIPLVATNAVHYLQPQDAGVLETLHAIGMGCSMDDEVRLQVPTDQAWFKTESEMREVFPDDLDAIERTVQVAERCEYHYDFKTYHFPATTPPDHVIDDNGQTLRGQPDTDPNWAFFYRAFPRPRTTACPSRTRPSPTDPRARATCAATSSGTPASA